MTSWLRHALLTLATMLLAAGVAAAFRLSFGWVLLATVCGGIVGVSLIELRESLRAGRLLAWLRGNLQDSAPRDPRLWGELAYRIERALRQRERQVADERHRLEQFLSAIEASPNGVMMLDANEQIEWCNRVSADHFGLDPDRDRLQRVTNLVRSPAFVAHLQSGQFGEPVVITNPLDRRSISALVRSYGDGLKLVLSQDITDRERAESMRRDFVANVSHEIRTPLTVLAGFVETLAAVPLTEPERQRVLHLMGQQTHRMQALVSDLLTLAQLEGSPRPAPDHWLHVPKLLERVQADALALSASRHQFSFSGGEGDELAGSDTELHSAVANLVTNAIRYTPDGGRIDVLWRRREEGGAVIEVRDNGIGIEREHLARLTERFYRVDSSRSRETGGTGLGLSIVKHVMQRHGGSVEVASEPGKGSVFTLSFPAARVRHDVPPAAGMRTQGAMHVD